jgi:hypothetical protein
LKMVRELEPTLFLSLDSDIFLHRDALKMLVEGVPRFSAVGGKAYMTPTSTMFPSFMNFPRQGAIERYDHASGPVPVDVIMACKLMTSAAYNIDYVYHDQGEDIGWSLACKAAGLQLGWDGRVTNKHAMAPEMVSIIDERVGF